MVCVELYEWLIEFEKILILPLTHCWVRHSYLLKRLQLTPYTCGLSGLSVEHRIGGGVHWWGVRLLPYGGWPARMMQCVVLAAGASDRRRAWSWFQVLLQCPLEPL